MTNSPATKRSTIRRLRWPDSTNSVSEKPGTVHLDEAVFMLGACASFASYLWRKHVPGEPS